ncbi:hypothetical protein BD414DRAFT_280723 [Trametes punicea]|nr:hypothetical protein BD414DRAFT_280723 [Trametes punicea]
MIASPAPPSASASVHSLIRVSWFCLYALRTPRPRSHSASSLSWSGLCVPLIHGSLVALVCCRLSPLHRYPHFPTSTPDQEVRLLPVTSTRSSFCPAPSCHLSPLSLLHHACQSHRVAIGRHSVPMLMAGLLGTYLGDMLFDDLDHCSNAGSPSYHVWRRGPSLVLLECHDFGLPSEATGTLLPSPFLPSPLLTLRIRTSHNHHSLSVFLAPVSSPQTLRRPISTLVLPTGLAFFLLHLLIPILFSFFLSLRSLLRRRAH